MKKDNTDLKMSIRRNTDKRIEVPKQGVREKYFSHSIFKTLSDIKDFYECLSGNDDTSTILAIKGEINVNWSILESLSNTIDSIITLLERGHVNDSLALMRKYSDAVFLHVYMLVLIEQGEQNFFEKEYADIYDNVLNQWVRGRSCLIEKKNKDEKTDAYLAEIRKRDATLTKLLFTKDNKTLYGEGRASFNDNIHHNNLESFRWNNDAFLDHETCLTVLTQAEKAIKLILAIHFAYITLLRPMALKTEDVGSCDIAPFADEIFKKYIVPEYSELASYLRHCSFLTFEE